jgi:malonyl-CoA/methylmalonyl-CoA synthetase
LIRLIDGARRWAARTAVVAGGNPYRYETLLSASAALAHSLLGGRPDLEEAPVAFLVPPGFDYVRTQWAIWRAGGIAVPLCLSHPAPTLRYVLEDTGAGTVVVAPGYENRIREALGGRDAGVIGTGAAGSQPVTLPDIAPQRRAMILYTSGTTSRPKGVVITHANLEAQISTLVQAWGWTADDLTLCILPLHHIHGIVNVVSCALWSGACCEFLPEFDAGAVLSCLEQERITVFMAVPTIYHKLIAAWEKLPVERQQRLSRAMADFRLMVSGSAALPVSVLERWRSISGHTLLERYGMTEIGMALSNPLHGERRPGFVGTPLPGVEIRLADEKYQPVPSGEPGEILVRGGNVFLEYWNRPEATREAFLPDGWFKTGDVAVVERDYCRILGRNSVDIIKSGGYKISALEIEEALRLHPAVRDCSVIGLESEEWGEIVAAALVLEQKDAEPEAIDRWLRTQIPSYKVPRRWAATDALPRNAMGKVVKNELRSLFELSQS